MEDAGERQPLLSSARRGGERGRQGLFRVSIREDLLEEPLPCIAGWAASAALRVGKDMQEALAVEPDAPQALLERPLVHGHHLPPGARAAFSLPERCLAPWR